MERVKLLKGNTISNILLSKSKVVLNDLAKFGMFFFFRINSDSVHFNGTSWNIDQYNETHKADQLVINKNLSPQFVNARELIITGLVNGLGIEDYNLTSSDWGKFCENITVDVMTVENGTLITALDEIYNEKENEIVLDGNLTINVPVNIKKLYFEKELNGINKTDFGKSNVDENGTLVVDGAQDFDHLVIYSTAFIRSNQINGVDVNSLAEDTVKINEPFSFTSATFGKFMFMINNIEYGSRVALKN